MSISLLQALPLILVLVPYHLYLHHPPMVGLKQIPQCPPDRLRRFSVLFLSLPIPRMTLLWPLKQDIRELQ